LNSPYTRAVLRYWWIAALGVLAAMALAVLAVDHVSMSFPPKLTPRKLPVYTAAAQLFVDGPDSPFLRTSVTESVASSSGGTLHLTPANSAPDTAVLLAASNLYPVIIQSDQVTALRERTYGTVEGSVVAQAAFATATPYGAYKLSPIPIIDVRAYSLHRDDARKLAQDTVNAFQLWLADKQSTSKIPDKQRVIVRQLQTPTSASKIDTSSFTAPAGVAILVIALAFGLIVLLDRRRAAQADPEAESTSGEPAVGHAHGAIPTSSPSPSTSP
jgi:hypothetical protein